MISQQIFYSIIRTIHDLGSAVWVGGLIIFIFVFMPTMRKVRDKSKGLNSVILIFYKNLTKFIIFTIPVLFITGILLARMNQNFQGLFHFTNFYSTILSVKVILVIIMLFIIILRKKSLKQFIELSDIKYKKRTEVYVVINMIIGIIVVFLSCVITIV